MVSNQLGHFDCVHDVSWCALNGRSFHYVVSCGVEGVFIWKFKVNPTCTIDILDVKYFRIDSDSVPVLASWNLMVHRANQATLVVVSSSNNTISLWKRTKEGDWNNVSQILPVDKMTKRQATPTLVNTSSRHSEFTQTMFRTIESKKSISNTPAPVISRDSMTPMMKFMMNPIELYGHHAER